MRKILLVLPFNENSGACVSARNLKNLLVEHEFEVDIASPSGSYLVQDITLPSINFNISNNIKALRVIAGVYNRYDMILFYTIRSSLMSVFFARSSRAFIYLHEVDVPPIILSSILSKVVIRYFIKNKLIVNPFMSRWYGNSCLLFPNVVDVNSFEIDNGQKDIDYIMISNFRVNKGVHDFLNIAKKMQKKKFLLLTNKELANHEELDVYLNDLPSNMTVSFVQSQKYEYLKRSKYLLNLSKLNETFGLTLIEALSVGVVPFCYYRDGFSFCLGPSALFLDETNVLSSINLFSDKLSVGNTYNDYLRQLIEYVEANFSNKVILGRLNELFHRI